MLQQTAMKEEHQGARPSGPGALVLVSHGYPMDIAELLRTCCEQLECRLWLFKDFCESVAINDWTYL